MTILQKSIDKTGLDYINETIDKMTNSSGLSPLLYRVDFLPEPLPNWENKSGADNFNHVYNAWFDFNKALNRLLVGNNPHRPSKRHRLIHSFNAFEMHKKEFKSLKIKTIPHQHSVIVVSGDLVPVFQSFLEVDKEQCLGSRSIAYKLKNNTYKWINHPVKSVTVKEVYDLEGAINYITKMWECIWRDEYNDERMIYIIPSENDFKFKLNDNFHKKGRNHA